MTETDLICPECGTKIERKHGMPAIGYTCPKCDKEWTMCLGKLVSREEFHETADSWHH